MLTATPEKRKQNQAPRVPGVRADARALGCDVGLLWRVLAGQRSDMTGLLKRYASLYEKRGLAAPAVPALQKIA